MAYTFHFACYELDVICIKQIIKCADLDCISAQLFYILKQRMDARLLLLLCNIITNNEKTRLCLSYREEEGPKDSLGENNLIIQETLKTLFVTIKVCHRSLETRLSRSQFLCMFPNYKTNPLSVNYLWSNF